MDRPVQLDIHSRHTSYLTTPSPPFLRNGSIFLTAQPLRKCSRSSKGADGVVRKPRSLPIIFPVIRLEMGRPLELDNDERDTEFFTTPSAPFFKNRNNFSWSQPHLPTHPVP